MGIGDCNWKVGRGEGLDLCLPINLHGVQSSYASFCCEARVSEILGGWERVIREGWGSEEEEGIFGFGLVICSCWWVGGGV